MLSNTYLVHIIYFNVCILATLNDYSKNVFVGSNRYGSIFRIRKQEVGGA